MPQDPMIGGIGISRHVCIDIDHDGLCDRCGHEVKEEVRHCEGCGVAHTLRNQVLVRKGWDLLCDRCAIQ